MPFPQSHLPQQNLSQSSSCGNLLSPSDVDYFSPRPDSETTLHTPTFFEHHSAPYLTYSPILPSSDLFQSGLAVKDPFESPLDRDAPPFRAQTSRSPILYDDVYNPSSSSSCSPSLNPHSPENSSSLMPPSSPYVAQLHPESQDPPLAVSCHSDMEYNLDAHAHCPRFPKNHQLNPYFVQKYQLKDELGSGGYGFVMTATHREEGYEVAVKFIIKGKVPDHAWMEDESVGRLPSEVMLLCFIDHPNIVKCLDLFDDPLYFYMVQELHGSPWHQADHSSPKQVIHAIRCDSPVPPLSSALSSRSEDSLRSVTPPPKTPSTQSFSIDSDIPAETTDLEIKTPSTSEKTDSSGLLKPVRPRLQYTRRPSHDLFECIEQSEHKRLPEAQARHVFAQVVDAVHYLDTQGVAHRDIKDENLVVDKNLNVKLIDFGSAIIVDSNEPRPFYTLFYGTAAYAASEILQKKPYQAAPAEVWTLGVLLSYLLTGSSPFPTVQDAIEGRIIIHSSQTLKLSKSCLHLLRRCLDTNPKTRATLAEIKDHKWLRVE